MEHTLWLKEREVYGVLKFYPANELAEKFCKLIRTKTLTESMILGIRDLGYTVVTNRNEFEKE